MIHVVTGGSASGKSEWAEQQVLNCGASCSRFYIATMQPWDDETKEKIRRHQKMRKEKKFQTIECFRDLETLQLPAVKERQQRVVLLECMSNLAANEMYRFDNPQLQQAVCDHIIKGIHSLQKQADSIIIVTNEVFSDGDSYSPETMLYRKILGQINQHLGVIADRVTEVVYGIPVCIKDKQ